MEDEYTKRRIKALKGCKKNKEIIGLINKIYEDGFKDGYEEKEKEE